jgi:tetratricopeptide (TPR) repeat protein
VIIQEAAAVSPARQSHRRQLLHQASILHQQGRTDDAALLYETVLQTEPQNFDYLYRLGLIRLEQHRWVDAEAVFRRAVKIDRHSAEAHHNIAFALTGLNRCEEAIKRYAKALKLRPDFAEAHNNLGHALELLDRAEDALAHYQKAVAIRPDYPEAHNNLGNALRALARSEEAIVHYRKALALNPAYSQAHENLGHAFRALGRREEAIAQFEAACALNPDDARAQNSCGKALQLVGKTEAAIVHFERAVALLPSFADAHNNLGSALREVGKVEEAAGPIARAVDLDPKNGSYYYNLAQSKRFKDDDPTLAHMRQLAQEIDSVSPEHHVPLYFALAKAYADLGDHEHSFHYILKGSNLRRKSSSYNEADVLGRLERIRSVFTAELIREKQGIGEPSCVPVFIVGMPRSGTTLLEQIVASHPKIFGAGELSEIPRLADKLRSPDGARFPETMLSSTREQLRQLGADYVHAVRSMAPAAERISDKLPGNFAHVGLIHLALPNARIIHTRRDLRDTALSCFSILFPPGNLEFTYDLAELGRFCRAYRTLMEHWREVLPCGVMLEVQYEELVDNLEEHARRIVAHCGLEWDDRCLSFHETERPVRTASVTQVRSPIYHSSIGRWRRYERQLQPLLRELAAAPSTS